jgi:hypothetical protein
MYYKDIRIHTIEKEWNARRYRSEMQSCTWKNFLYHLEFVEPGIGALAINYGGPTELAGQSDWLNLERYKIEGHLQ